MSVYVRHLPCAGGGAHVYFGGYVWLVWWVRCWFGVCVGAWLMACVCVNGLLDGLYVCSVGGSVCVYRV